MTTWPKITIRTIALGNIAMGALGLFLQLDSAVRFSQRHQFIGTRPGETYAYSTLACIAFAFALLALVSGFFLWRTSRSALRLCNLLFGSELIYWVAGAMSDVILATSKSEWAHNFATSVASVSGVGNMGLAPQVLSLYPVWALVLLNLAYWRAGKAEPPSHLDTVRTGGWPGIKRISNCGHRVIERVSLLHFPRKY